MVTQGWRRFCCVMAAALFLAPAARADVLIDFEALTPWFYGPGEVLAVDGYEFTFDPLAIGVVDSEAGFFFGNAPTNSTGQFLSILNDGAVLLEEQNQVPFALKSFAFGFIGPLPGSGVPGTTVGQIKVGAVGTNGNAIVQSFDFVVADAEGNFSFGPAVLGPTFGSLTSVTFSACLYLVSGECGIGDVNLAQFALDNLLVGAAVAAVPEPGTLPLLALALGAFVAARRRTR